MMRRANCFTPWTNAGRHRTSVWNKCIERRSADGTRIASQPPGHGATACEDPPARRAGMGRVTCDSQFPWPRGLSVTPSQQTHNFLGGDGPAEMVALDLIAIVAAEELCLLLCLDPFRHNTHTELLTE